MLLIYIIMALLKTPKLESVAYQTYGFEYGTDAASNAIEFQKNINQTQLALNKTHGGSYGIPRGKTLVATFPQSGPTISPIGANSASVQTNTTSINSINDGYNDCYATNSCGIIGGKKRNLTFRRRTIIGKTRKSRKNKNKSKSKSNKNKKKNKKNKSNKTKHMRTNKN
jgi:hypothetical protein